MTEVKSTHWIPGIIWFLLGIVLGAIAVVAADANVKGQSVNWNLFGRGYGWSG